ncbi:MAG: ribosomal RNA small subunit methyltransferase A [Deltaproteobacteria bacterium]|nr:ribosomal RNA small subunit methyltransferase A [Deltaproteobacteria bacterium]
MISPRILLAANNLRPKKQLWQNFLKDISSAEMIVARSGVTPENVVLEIGAGLGALTIPLAHSTAKVYAVEKDREIIKILRTQMLTSNLTNVELIEEDILKVDLNAIAKMAGCRIVVMGNLPYNISSQVLVQLIRGRADVSRAILMFQKELAQRITARPGSKAYGRLTVMLRYCADVGKLADLKASHFYPKPKVDSEVLEIIFRDDAEYSANDETFFFRVIKAAFGKRRKTLKNALAGNILGIDTRDAEAALERAGIDPVRRAETLTVKEFAALSNTLFNFNRKPEHKKMG